MEERDFNSNSEWIFSNNPNSKLFQQEKDLFILKKRFRKEAAFLRENIASSRKQILTRKVLFKGKSMKWPIRQTTASEKKRNFWKVNQSKKKI